MYIYIEMKLKFMESRALSSHTHTQSPQLFKHTHENQSGLEALVELIVQCNLIYGLKLNPDPSNGDLVSANLGVNPDRQFLIALQS